MGTLPDSTLTLQYHFSLTYATQMLLSNKVFFIFDQF